MSDSDAQNSIKTEDKSIATEQNNPALTEQASTTVAEEATQKSSEQESSQNNEQIAANSEVEKEKEVTYTNGQLLRFVRIRFPGNSKSFPFLIGEKEYTYGQQVVAMSDRGLDIGYINSFPYEAKFREAMLPLKSISKVAGKEDFEKIASMKDKEFEAENICKELITKFELEMDLTHVELIQFGKKAVFYFIAPKRVDFRDLVKDLVTKLKLRVELRQISVRDRAAALGGIGPCGRELCCSTFLSNYGRVNIRMAKNQNMALNPTRLNGLCGQLKCCLSYEDNVYTHKREQLPREGNFVKLANGDQGKILKLHVLILRFDMLTDQGAIRRYTFDQYNSDLSLPKDWKFPNRFDHVTNETSKIIGSVEKEASEEDDILFANSEITRSNDPNDSAENAPQEAKADVTPNNKSDHRPNRNHNQSEQKKEPQKAQSSERDSDDKPNKKRSRNRRNNNRRRQRKPNQAKNDSHSKKTD